MKKTEKTTTPNTGVAKKETVNATSTFSISIIAVLSTLVGLVGLTKKYLARK